ISRSRIDAGILDRYPTPSEKYEFERVCLGRPAMAREERAYGSAHRGGTRSSKQWAMRLRRAGGPSRSIKITACRMRHMPQAVEPLTVRRRNGPSPSFAHAVAAIAVSVAHAPIEVTTRPNVWLARCDLLFLVPDRRGSRRLGGRTRRLVAVTAQGVDVRDAHIAASHRAGSTVPFIRCLRSVPLARVTRVFVRVDIGLCICRRHTDDHRQNAQSTDQSVLHQLTSLWTRKCHTFYW